MLEWYRPGAGMAALMDRDGGAICAPCCRRCDLPRRRRPTSPRFERLTVAEAFARYVGADVLATAGDAAALWPPPPGAALRDGETWEDLFFRLLLERVEPQLGRAHPTFLTHWPAAQAALARRDPADPRVAERFELFVCGIELANAFVELTDAGGAARPLRGGPRPPPRASAARTGRSTRISWPPWRTACRPAPASRWASTGWR